MFELVTLYLQSASVISTFLLWNRPASPVHCDCHCPAQDSALIQTCIGLVKEVATICSDTNFQTTTATTLGPDLANWHFPWFLFLVLAFIFGAAIRRFVAVTRVRGTSGLISPLPIGDSPPC